MPPIGFAPHAGAAHRLRSARPAAPLRVDVQAAQRCPRCGAPPMAGPTLAPTPGMVLTPMMRPPPMPSPSRQGSPWPSPDQERMPPPFCGTPQASPREAAVSSTATVSWPPTPAGWGVAPSPQAMPAMGAMSLSLIVETAAEDTVQHAFARRWCGWPAHERQRVFAARPQDAAMWLILDALGSGAAQWAMPRAPTPDATLIGSLQSAFATHGLAALLEALDDARYALPYARLSQAIEQQRRHIEPLLDARGSA